MENEMSLQEQKLLDRAVKHTLAQMDDIRKTAHNLQPLNGTTHNRPPEQSIQMVEQWRQMADERANLRAQQLLSDSDDEHTDFRINSDQELYYEDGGQEYYNDEDTQESHHKDADA